MQDTEILERVGTVVASLPEGPAEAVSVDEGYDFTITPNDFNVDTLCNFMESGGIKVPIYQRDYVWSQRDASRFIESVALGFPTPEIFVYEKGRNNWEVVDGHQRLLSLYYFVKGRFPISRVKGAADIVPRLRRGKIPLDNETLSDNRLFSDFALDVTPPYKGQPGKLHGKVFAMLSSDMREQIVRRPIRTVVIREHGEKRGGINAHVGRIEIFERLNTGGKNLSAQQIRDCVFESPLLQMVNDLNNNPSWRKMVGAPLVSRRRDAEFVLRALAMLARGDEYLSRKSRYLSPVNKFLDQFCAEMFEKKEDDEEIRRLREMFEGFMRACEGLEDVFVGRSFRSALFEAVFVASLGECYQKKRKPRGKLRRNSVESLLQDKKFEAVSGKAVMKKSTAERRIEIARGKIQPL